MEFCGEPLKCMFNNSRYQGGPFVNAEPPFGKLRSLFWPIYRWEIKKLIPLFILYALICFNYNILKIGKDSLVITAIGSGAEAIPFLKIWGILPMALLMMFLFDFFFILFNFV